MQFERLRLVADIGGTRTRLALSHSGDAVEQTRVISTGESDSLVGGAQKYLDGLTERPAPVEAVVAVASPVTGDRVELTNRPWGFSIEDTRRDLGLERPSVINDVEAVAAALPYMEEGDLLRLGGLHIGGAIARNLGPNFNADLFRKRFAAKGRHHDYLASVPAYLIQHRCPALLGATHLSLEDGR